MIADKPTFAKGAGLMASFTVVFVLIFIPPVFGGKKSH